MSNESDTDTEQYSQTDIHLCQSCKDTLDVGDDVVTLSDGFIGPDESYAVTNRRFWHIDCWEEERVSQGDSEEHQGDDSGTERTRTPCKDCGYRPTFAEIEEYGSSCPKCGGHGGDPSTGDVIHMANECDNDLDEIITRLEEALEIQQNTEGEIAKTPTVAYCFDCDDITVDEIIPDECIDHKTVSGDGYEHAGINSAITALQFVRSITSLNQDRNTSDNNG